jgi:hypothetical protein
MKNRKAAALALILLAAPAVTSCAQSKTDASNMSCVYNGGPLDSTDFRQYIAPGEGRKFVGFRSKVIDVPVTIRQYRVSLDPASGDTPVADSINVKVKGIDMKFEPTINFTINTEVDSNGKPVACTFVEKNLRAIDATDFNTEGGNWQYGFLNERFRPVLQDVGTRILQKYDPTKLTFNTDGQRDAAAKEIGEALPEALAKALGGNYFCGPDYAFGGAASTCGPLSVTLPEPVLLAADMEILASPQRAATEANNAIAVANEQARAAKETADAREDQVDAEERRSKADKAIEEARAVTAGVEIKSQYAWCAYVASLNQDCALVKAAENGDYPDIVGTSPGLVVPVNTTPSTTVAP